jgi:hypothetical protein
MADKPIDVRPEDARAALGSVEAMRRAGASHVRTPPWLVAAGALGVLLIWSVPALFPGNAGAAVVLVDVLTLALVAAIVVVRVKLRRVQPPTRFDAAVAVVWTVTVLAMLVLYCVGLFIGRVDHGLAWAPVATAVLAALLFSGGYLIMEALWREGLRSRNADA